jgi:hypothetical protein
MSRAQVPRRRLWQGGGLALAAVLTVALTQNTTTAAFTAQTSDTGNRVTARADFCTATGTSVTLPNPTYPNVYDTALYESQPVLNYSTSVQLGIVAPAGGRVRTLIKFTLPSRPAGCGVASATLSLRVTNGAVGAGLVAYRAAATWNPTGVTWNTDPGFVVGSGTSTGSTAAGTWTQWNVSSQVTALYAGPDYGFELRDALEGTGSTAQLYDSMESTTVANRPQLTITWG